MKNVLQIDGKEKTFRTLANLYQKVWGLKDHQSIYENFLRHSTYEGYQGLATENSQGEIIGFAYGYTSLPGQYYNNLLIREFGPEEKEKWFGNCFEFVELLVDPLYRKQGYGRLLAGHLLEGINHNTAILTTQAKNHAAQHLYRQLGLQVIKEPFYPNVQSEPFVIMGKE
ncbi:GNAT family N-acetyltransferase [Virgibacillus sp. MSP4-1]|uniref:GNAT family N-acetyltransferase n=1 Tax=Virgibacillus sp. MSP4-1 TaxID=2700081 RepID=UPI0003A25EEB|nr:GNAT family N-acetyltransferase [Virgibacillus sp. MSP4-1]QHS21736.1 GNAT family N-acetyltransferase [Virgibacillus sp. MSP4-1]